MMQRYVNQAYEAVIPIVIKYCSKLKSVNAVIDTGFTGFLSLPSSIVAELELPWSYRDRATLGDGSETFSESGIYMKGSILCNSTMPDGEVRNDGVQQ
jgi:predicted aspartyl protease